LPTFEQHSGKGGVDEESKSRVEAQGLCYPKIGELQDLRGEGAPHKKDDLARIGVREKKGLIRTRYWGNKSGRRRSGLELTVSKHHGAASSEKRPKGADEAGVEENIVEWEPGA